MIRERTRAGLAEARERGARVGRPAKLRRHQQQEVIRTVREGSKTAADAESYPVLNSHRKLLEFAQDHRLYVVVQPDPTFAINACNAREDTLHTPHMVYRLRQDELGWHCDYQDIL
jgi:hypothetical protein